jgi:hypothetical protein
VRAFSAGRSATSESVAIEEEDIPSYELVYREAIRALDFQRAALDALRTRAGILLSGGAVATSFFGGVALRDEVSNWDWLAVFLFIAFGLLVLRVLWPQAEGAEGFTATPSIVIANYLEGEEKFEVGNIYRDLALYAEEAHDHNRDHHLAPLTWFFRIATVTLVVEIVAWVVAIAAA